MLRTSIWHNNNFETFLKRFEKKKKKKNTQVYPEINILFEPIAW